MVRLSADGAATMSTIEVTQDAPPSLASVEASEGGSLENRTMCHQFRLVSPSIPDSTSADVDTNSTADGAPVLGMVTR